MKKNSKKKGEPVRTKSAGSKMPDNKKKIMIIAISAALIVALTVGIVAIVLATRSFDYMTANLGRYVDIPEEIYKNFSVKSDTFDGVTDEDVERRINKVLVENRAKEASYKGANVTSLPVSLGDTVYIYYRGYTVDEDGKETDIPKASNFTSETEDTLDIGSMTFIAGFEEGLIGVVPNEHERFEKITEGEITAGDVIYISYKAFLPDGKTKDVVSERVDLSLSDIDEKYGEGFKAFFLGEEAPDGSENEKKSAGQSISKEVTFKLGNSGTAAYYDIKIDFITRCESDPVVIEAYFPKSYQDKELRGVNVKFDVYVRYINIYDVPEFTDEFITETLKMTEEDLSNYDGDTLTEKFRSYKRGEAEADAEKAKSALIEEMLWDNIVEKAVIKKLPEDLCEAGYNEVYAQLEADFEKEGEAYNDISEYAVVYFGLGEGEDFREYIKEHVEGIITEDLIFYYIIREENLFPSDAEYSYRYINMLEEYVEIYKDSYSEELDKCETEEEEKKVIEGIKEDILSYYGQSYFEDAINYEYMIEKLSESVTVVD